jgi:CHAT domain
MDQQLQIEIRYLIENNSGELQAIDKLFMWASTEGKEHLTTIELARLAMTTAKKNEEEGLKQYSEAIRTQKLMGQKMLNLLDKVTINNTLINENKPLSEQNRILFLAANPVDTRQLDLQNEYIKMDLQLQNSIDFKIFAEWATTVDTLQKVILDKKPHMIHFSGHGIGESIGDIQFDDKETIRKLGGPDISENDIVNGLVLMDALTQKKFIVPGRALANLFKLCQKQFDLQLIFLNACSTEEQAIGISENGLFVVGMSKEITDTSAKIFSTSFYQYLAGKKNIIIETLKDAFCFAQNALELNNRKDANVPVLYHQGKKIEITI